MRRLLVSIVLLVAGFVAGLVVTGRMRTASESRADAGPVAQAPAGATCRAARRRRRRPLARSARAPTSRASPRQAVKGVANISSLQVVRQRRISPFANDPFFRYFFGDSDMFGSRDRRR